jgi:hypothetical protein
MFIPVTAREIHQFSLTQIFTADVKCVSTAHEMQTAMQVKRLPRQHNSSTYEMRGLMPMTPGLGLAVPEEQKT